MDNFKKNIFKLSHIIDPFTTCTIVSGVDSTNNPFFFMDGFTEDANASLTFLLYDVFDDVSADPMQIGINGDILTEGTPLTINTLITPGGGNTYDYEAIVNPLTNYDNGIKDTFKIDVTINSIEGQCTNNTTNGTLLFLVQPVEVVYSSIDLWFDQNTACPTSNPVSYYIEGGVNNWANATELKIDIDGNIDAPAGHYSPSNTGTVGSGTSRQWDGNSFVSSEFCL
jgi:hypothetical protein